MAAQEVPIPFAEPPWIQGLPSPYYNESHRQWQKDVRAWLKDRFTDHTMEWEEAGTVPENVFKDFFSENMLIPYMPAPLPVQMLKSLGIHKILNLRVEDFDYTHFAIYVSEMKKSGLGGPASSLSAGVAYGIPPIIKYGNQQLKDRFLPILLKGEKRICLAITEPSAGSDVANISTTAKKSADGKYYIINGSKKWITNGIWSHYTTMAVRTGGPGRDGLSLVVVPLLGHPGVSMRRLKTSGAVSGGTTYIELDDVKVPVENLIGEEGAGMRYIMTNFNHERLTICVGTTRAARVALAAAFEYVMKREAFGKPLIDQPVVRHRLAKCGAEVESLDAWVQQFVYQVTHLKKEVADAELGGLTAMCKAKAGMVLDEVARTAVLLFGGNGFTRSGMGELVEKIYREVPGSRIPGGSEDVMLDLSIRQLVKNYKAKTKALESSAGARL